MVEKTQFVGSINIVGAFDRPKGITTNLKWLNRVQKQFFWNVLFSDSKLMIIGS